MSDAPFGTRHFSAARVALLSEGGVPQAGADNGYFLREVTEATIGVNKQKGDRDTKRRGDGNVCQTAKDPDVTLSATWATVLCVLDAQFIGLVTGSDVFLDGEDPLGYQILSVEDGEGPPVCWEGWSKAWDGSIQATDADGDLLFHHWVLPFLRGSLDDIKADAKIGDIPLSGESDRNPNIPTSGPFDDWPAAIISAGGVTKPYGVFLDTLPTTETGLVTVPVVGS